MNEKKRIIVDLDVLTLAFWDNKDEAKLVEKIKKGIYAVVTPYIILDHLAKWNHRKLADKISGFYEMYSAQIVTAKNILDEISEDEYGKLLFRLVSVGVKEEDVVLVIVSSVFGADCLVTFNRKHLKSKEKEINEVLRKNGKKPIKILFPEEL